MSAERGLRSEATSVIRQYCEGPVVDWRTSDVIFWAATMKHYSMNVISSLREQRINGAILLELSERDVRSLRTDYHYPIKLGELKRLWLDIREIQTLIKGTTNTDCCGGGSGGMGGGGVVMNGNFIKRLMPGQVRCASAACRYQTIDDYLLDCCADKIPHEYFKTIFALSYSLLVTWITSFVMVIVHERVPDMQRYPPLPDIFLDNIPRIPWAFHCTEITGVVLFVMWTIVCIFHKHRLVLLRRFFALAGSVFLLRCVTMLITSLSVPGSHLQCQKMEYVLENENMDVFQAFKVRLSRAYHIWSGMGLAIKGVHTCGDYMFSGHTVALTLLNFFITEYTPRHMYYLHTFTWILNMFGVFFILAAHEHYSIDVFIAFFITSRLFLYYHTLANNHAQMVLDSTRSKVWFPIFFFLEQSVDGSIPNEYDSIETLINSIKFAILTIITFFAHKILFVWNLRLHFLRIIRIHPGHSLNMPGHETIGTSTSFEIHGTLPNDYFQRHRHRSKNSFSSQNSK